MTENQAECAEEGSGLGIAPAPSAQPRPHALDQDASPRGGSAPPPGVSGSAVTGSHQDAPRGGPAPARDSGRLLRVIARLPDGALRSRVERLAGRERRATTLLVAYLAELDARRLHLADGYPSLFAYCTQALHLSEYAAYHRIQAARAVRRFPVLLGELARGHLTLTTLSLLAPHLTAANLQALLAEARGASKRAVEALVARLQPRPPVPASVRRLPAPAGPVHPASGGSAHPVPGGPAHPALGDSVQPVAGGPERSVPGSLASPLPGGPAPQHGRPPTPAPSPTLGIDGIPAGVAGDTSVAPALAGDETDRVAPGTPTGGPARFPGPGSCGRGPSGAVTPLAPTRYRVQFTAGPGTYAKLKQCQDLLRHQIPDGDLAQLFDRALTALLRELMRRRVGTPFRPEPTRTTPAAPPAGSVPHAAPAPTPGDASASDAGAPTRPAEPSRHIPAAVRRVVWERDGGQCAFVSADGRRCPARGYLEFHHVRPYALGGPATVENIQLRCRAHNGYEADQIFGPPPARRSGPFQQSDQRAAMDPRTAAHQGTAAERATAGRATTPGRSRPTPGPAEQVVPRAQLAAAAQAGSAPATTPARSPDQPGRTAAQTGRPGEHSHPP